MKSSTHAIALTIGQNGKKLGVVGLDRSVRIFSFETGKIIFQYDDSFNNYQIKREQSDPLYFHYANESFDMDKRMLLEKEIEKNYENFYYSSLDFDESEEFLVLPSPIGMKLIYMKENRLISVFGCKENTERFVKGFLYQGESLRNPAVNNHGGMLSHVKETDPILICLGFKRNRFYMFSRRMPEMESEKGVVRGKFL